MKELLTRIYLYFKSKAIWNAKMSEHLEIRVINTNSENSKDD